MQATAREVKVNTKFKSLQLSAASAACNQRCGAANSP